MPSVRQYLTEYLLKCNKLQIQAEKIRQTIASNPYFQVVSVFERFDKFRKGYLEPADFSEFMLENHVYPTEEELYLIFKDFDQKKLGVVTIDDFQAEILTRENRKLKKDALSRNAYPVELKLSIDLEFILGRYFQNKIEAIKELNRIRDQIKILKPYASQDAFLELDCNKKGYLTSTDELDNFLRKNGKALSNEQLSRIYSVLSFHRNTQITFEMFKQHIDPLFIGCYPGYRQKIREKEAIEYRFLENKYNLERSRAENIYHRQSLHNEIADLRDSNRRLHQIIDEQDFISSVDRYRYRY